MISAMSTPKISFHTATTYGKSLPRRDLDTDGVSGAKSQARIMLQTSISRITTRQLSSPGTGIPL